MSLRVIVPGENLLRTDWMGYFYPFCACSPDRSKNAFSFILFCDSNQNTRITLLPITLQFSQT